MDPIIRFFLFGLAAGLLKSESKLRQAVYEFVFIQPLSIGRKGGIDLHKQPFLHLAPAVGATLEFGLLMAVLAKSVSCIALPAALRISVTALNPTLSLTASPGIVLQFRTGSPGTCDSAITKSTP